MLCISFGWLIVFTIITIFITMILPGALKPLGNIVIAGLIVWFIAGFFKQCTSTVSTYHTDHTDSKVNTP